MSVNDMARVLMYVNPESKAVEKMVCFTPFGMTERIDSDWKPTSMDKSGVLDLSADKIYQLDWDTDFLAMDSDDDESEHAAIDMFDAGNLTEDGCKKYGMLVVDPTSVDGDAEIAAEVEKLNNTTP